MENLQIISGNLISESDSDPPSTCPQGSPEHPGVRRPESKPTELLKALEVVERDSAAIAESFASLFASLRLALSEVTSSSVEHIRCFSDAAGRLQESALDAATRGNRYINSCLRLNEEMKGVDDLALQLGKAAGFELVTKPFVVHRKPQISDDIGRT